MTTFQTEDYEYVDASIFALGHQLGRYVQVEDANIIAGEYTPDFPSNRFDSIATAAYNFNLLPFGTGVKDVKFGNHCVINNHGTGTITVIDAASNVVTTVEQGESKTLTTNGVIWRTSGAGSEPWDNRSDGSPANRNSTDIEYSRGDVYLKDNTLFMDSATGVIEMTNATDSTIEADATTMTLKSGSSTAATGDFKLQTGDTTGHKDVLTVTNDGTIQGNEYTGTNKDLPAGDVAKLLVTNATGEFRTIDGSNFTSVVNADFTSGVKVADHTSASGTTNIFVPEDTVTAIVDGWRHTSIAGNTSDLRLVYNTTTPTNPTLDMFLGSSLIQQIPLQVDSAELENVDDVTFDANSFIMTFTDPDNNTVAAVNLSALKKNLTSTNNTVNITSTTGTSPDNSITCDLQVFAENGLTIQPTGEIHLGGDLIKATDIAMQGFDFSVNGAAYTTTGSDNVGLILSETDVLGTGTPGFSLAYGDTGGETFGISSSGVSRDVRMSYSDATATERTDVIVNDSTARMRYLTPGGENRVLVNNDTVELQSIIGAYELTTAPPVDTSPTNILTLDTTTNRIERTPYANIAGAWDNNDGVGALATPANQTSGAIKYDEGTVSIGRAVAGATKALEAQNMEIVDGNNDGSFTKEQIVLSNERNQPHSIRTQHSSAVGATNAVAVFVNDGTTANEQLSVNGVGQVRANSYGVGTFDDATPARLAAFTGTGQMVEYDPADLVATITKDATPLPIWTVTQVSGATSTIDTRKFQLGACLGALPTPNETINVQIESYNNVNPLTWSVTFAGSISSASISGTGLLTFSASPSPTQATIEVTATDSVCGDAVTMLLCFNWEDCLQADTSITTLIALSTAAGTPGALTPNRFYVLSDTFGDGTNVRSTYFNDCLGALTLISRDELMSGFRRVSDGQIPVGTAADEALYVNEALTVNGTAAAREDAHLDVNGNLTVGQTAAGTDSSSKISFVDPTSGLVGRIRHNWGPTLLDSTITTGFTNGTLSVSGNETVAIDAGHDTSVALNIGNNNGSSTHSLRLGQTPNSSSTTFLVRDALGNVEQLENATFVTKNVIDEIPTVVNGTVGTAAYSTTNQYAIAQQTTITTPTSSDTILTQGGALYTATNILSGSGTGTIVPADYITIASPACNWRVECNTVELTVEGLITYTGTGDFEIAVVDVPHVGAGKLLQATSNESRRNAIIDVTVVDGALRIKFRRSATANFFNENQYPFQRRFHVTALLEF